MTTEFDIMLNIYTDLCNSIEHIKSSKTKINNIKKSINSLNNNFFDIKCNDHLFSQYIVMFDDDKSYNELIANLEALKDDFELKIKHRCNHEWVKDLIDIGPDKTKEICYCSKCEITKR